MRCDEKCKWFPPSSLGGKPCTFCEPDSLLSNCYEEREEKPITHADRFRSMSDEELAGELLDLFIAFYAVEWSEETILDWLRQEADHV